MFGPGRALDPTRSFIVCVNVLGGCQGSTGPASLDPDTGKPYGSSFPVVTIRDMVRTQALLADHLGVRAWQAVVGGSMGGMQALEWAVMFPERVRSLVALATTAAASAQQIAWSMVGRRAILVDPNFAGGDYYDHEDPLRGLQVARMLGHMTYLSQEALQRKFGRRRRGATRQFEIDSYFEYQGKKFAALYDANSYIRVQAAMDEMDLEEQYGDLQSAFARWRGRTLIVSFDTDWLFPPTESERVATAMRQAGTPATHIEIASANGHDTFLIDFHLIDDLVRQFLGG